MLSLERYADKPLSYAIALMLRRRGISEKELATEIMYMLPNSVSVKLTQEKFAISELIRIAEACGYLLVLEPANENEEKIYLH